MTTIPDDIYRLQTSENLAIKQLANAVVAINDSGGGGDGSTPDLSGYATKSGLYKDGTTPVDLETTCQGFETAINGMSAPDLSAYATKSGLYKDGTTAVDLEGQCQDIETRVALLETPAMRMNEQDMDAMVKKLATEIVKNTDNLKVIVKAVTDAITTQKTTT